MNIKQKLIAGFGLMIILTGLAAGIGCWQARQASTNTTSVLKTDMPLLKWTTQSHVDLKNARIEEKLFLLDKDPEAFQRAQAHLNRIKENFKQTHAALSDEKSRNQVQSALTLVDDYGSNFQKVVELKTQRGLTHNEGLEGRLRKAVHKVEKVVTELGLVELNVLMLMCRRHEKDYMLRGDEKYFSRIAKRIEEFNTQMEIFGMSSDDQAHLMILLKDYHQGMASIVKIDKEINSAILAMTEIITQLERQVNALTESTYGIIDANGEALLSGLSFGRTLLNFILAGAVALGILIGFYIIRSITRPISKVVDMFKYISEGEGEGDLTKRLTVDSNDEIGELSRWFNTFVEKIRGILKQIAENAEVLSSSSTELSAISQQMSTYAEETSGKSNTVATAAEEMSSNMDSVAAATEEASTNIGMVATASEEMTAVINEIAQNTKKTRAITGEAVSEAKSTSDRVDELGKAANEIGKVTETITEISEQTNLLALNATIEAARAGEAGKGFAVVANEIKELAKQTADATGEIKQKIEGIQSSTEGTVTRIEQISKVINDVNEMIATIATAVEEQSVTTEEITNNVVQASQGIQEVTENVAQSSTVSGEIAKDIADVNQASSKMSNSSSQVNMSAEELSKLAEQLKEMVGKFKV